MVRAAVMAAVVLLALALFLPCGSVGAQASAPPSSGAAPGEYLVVFPPSSFVLAFQGGARDAAFKALVSTQKEYLRDRYQLEVVTVYDAIGRTNGKGMYHVRSSKGAASEEESRKLLERLGKDSNLESVSPNRQEGLAEPAGAVKKP